MTQEHAIIEDHLLERRLVAVWEMVRDDCPTIVEAYALSLEGYFLEVETMLDVSAIGIGCGHCRAEAPFDVRPGCSYRQVTNDRRFSSVLDKRLAKWRLVVGEMGNWEGLMVTFGTSVGLCFLSVNCSMYVLNLAGTQC